MNQSLKECRCFKCNKKLLDTAEYSQIIIKCPRCKVLNRFMK